MYCYFFAGSPIKSINMYCWSLFRDVDFHNRFHFDHYEFSGQWHGQYRGYQHGRVHQVKRSSFFIFLFDRLILHLKLYYFFKLRDVGAAVLVEWLSPSHYLNPLC